MPKTIDHSLAHDGVGRVGGIKTDEGDWDESGHKGRILSVNKDTLSLFAKLYDTEGTPALEAKLPALHSAELLSVLDKFASYPNRLSNLNGEFLSLEMWHETNAQTEGIITRNTIFPSKSSDWVCRDHIFMWRPQYIKPLERLV